MYKTEITPLSVYFKGKGEVNGKTFTQVRKSANGFIYRVESEGNMYYEVFERRINSRFEKVSYPRSKSFGMWAWTYPSLNTALKKLNQINAK